jgi:hypothetical protein
MLLSMSFFTPTPGSSSVMIATISAMSRVSQAKKAFHGNQNDKLNRFQRCL